MVVVSKGDNNAAYYLHRRGSFPPLLLFHQQPSFTNLSLATTHPIVVTARDGLAVPGYLTLPVLPHIPSQLPAALAGAVPALHTFRALQRAQGQQPPPEPQQQPGGDKVDWRLPMVLLVHGGPWRRTSWGSNAAVTQWLANRG